MRESFFLALRGVCMGIADVIPGVSGGTMALVLGIYGTLISSIRQIDALLIRALLRGDFYRRFFPRLLDPLGLPAEDPIEQRADAVAFLCVLLLGITTAILIGARFIPALMADHPETLRGFFLGLVLMSVLAPWREMRSRRGVHLGIFMAFALTTFVVVGGHADQSSFAQGEFSLVRGDTTPPRELIVAPDLRWVGGEGKDPGKHGLAYRPARRTVWPADRATHTIDVVATRAGADGNTDADTTWTAIRGADTLPGIAVVQNAALGDGNDPPLSYLALCGAIAISAMILPGLSGAFLLLLLGQYDYILFQLHLVITTLDESAIPRIGVFLAGIALGILLFSRILHWLLSRAHDGTMAALAGLMVGSIRRLWPWQEIGVHGSLNTLPAEGTWVMPLAASLIGMALIALFLRIDLSDDTIPQ